MIKSLVTCDCCKEHIPKNDVSVIVETYQTNTVKVMCPNCVETVNKYMTRLRIHSDTDNNKRIRKFIEHLSQKNIVTHIPNKQDPVEDMTLKIFLTVVFYTLFSLIAITGLTGTLLLTSGIIPALSILTMLTAWGLITYKVFSGIKTKLTTFVLDTERTYDDFLREDLYNRDMQLWNQQIKSGSIKINTDGSTTITSNLPWND